MDGFFKTFFKVIYSERFLWYDFFPTFIKTPVSTTSKTKKKSHKETTSPDSGHLLKSHCFRHLVWKQSHSRSSVEALLYLVCFQDTISSIYSWYWKLLRRQRCLSRIENVSLEIFLPLHLRHSSAHMMHSWSRITLIPLVSQSHNHKLNVNDTGDLFSIWRLIISS